MMRIPSQSLRWRLQSAIPSTRASPRGSSVGKIASGSARSSSAMRWEAPQRWRSSPANVGASPTRSAQRRGVATSDLEEVLSNLVPKKRRASPETRAVGETKSALRTEGTEGETAAPEGEMKTENVPSNLDAKKRTTSPKTKAVGDTKSALRIEGTEGETAVPEGEMKTENLPSNSDAKKRTTSPETKVVGETKSALPKERTEGEAKSATPEGEANARNALPEEGSQRAGTVTRLARFGAFVRLDGLDRDALLRASEIRDHYVGPHQISMFVRPGMRIVARVEKVDVQASGKVDIAVSTRPSKVRDVVPDDFDPLTLVVFNLPYDMTEMEVGNLFGEYGDVVEVRLLPMFAIVDHEWFLEEDESRRKLTLVTFARQDEGEACMRQLHQRHIPYEIGGETCRYRIGVKKSRQQDFKRRLQDRFDEEFAERQARADPEMRRVQRAADRMLRDMIPWDYY